MCIHVYDVHVNTIKDNQEMGPNPFVFQDSYIKFLPFKMQTGSY